MIRKRIVKFEEDKKENKTSATPMKKTGFFKEILKKILKWVVVAYVLLPIIVCVVPQITEQMIYSNMLTYFKDNIDVLQNPVDKYKLEGTTSFHINCDDVELGLWHVLPRNEISMYTKDSGDRIKKVENQLIRANVVVIYHHGSGTSRAIRFNKTIYQVLQSVGYHTVSFDYRGFGDSSGWPSESGLVNDSLCVLNWVKRRLKPDASVYFWGHSLGTAATTLAAKRAFDICEVNQSASCPQVDGLILEGGFTNIRAGAHDDALVQILAYFYSNFILSNALEIAFKTLHAELAVDTNLFGIKCPVMLLHAEDDDVIPCQHSADLYNVCKSSSSRVKEATFIKFRNFHHLGHFNIPKVPELPNLLRGFVTKDNQATNYQILLV